MFATTLITGVSLYDILTRCILSGCGLLINTLLTGVSSQLFNEVHFRRVFNITIQPRGVLSGFTVNYL